MLTTTIVAEISLITGISEIELELSNDPYFEGVTQIYPAIDPVHMIMRSLGSSDSVGMLSDKKGFHLFQSLFGIFIGNAFKRKLQLPTIHSSMPVLHGIS